MTTLDSLRKEYDKLKPFERAVMTEEATSRFDEGLVDALCPPSLWDAYQTAGHSRIFEAIAFYAIHESQNGEVLYWLSHTGVLTCECGEAWEGEANSKNDKRIELFLSHIEEGERRRLAWVLALQALDKETGGACMVSARIFAGRYVEATLSKADAATVDYSAELGHLRELWTAAMQNCPDAPKVKESPAGGTQ